MAAMPSGVARVCVFRALVLGDLLCATPALRALRAALPGAHIALVGLPATRDLVSRLASVDEFIDFPGWPGLPERAIDAADAPARFIAGQRARKFDLALQLHGSGQIVNPLVHAFGARHSAGFTCAAAWTPPDDAARYVAWPEHGTEVERLLALTDHLGCTRRGLQLDFPLSEADRQAAAELLDARAPASMWTRAVHGSAAAVNGSDREDGAHGDHSDHGSHGGRHAPGRSIASRPYAVVHPGSQLPSRRWAPQRFAAVADALAERGLTVLLTGSAAEAPLTAEVARAMRHRPIDLAGRTGLWTLGALLERAALLLSNDTGLSHVAAALGTPSVIVSSGGDAPRWQPHDRTRHTVLWHDLPCRPCAHAHCPTAHECATAVTVEQVRDAALAAASTAPTARTTSTAPTALAPRTVDAAPTTTPAAAAAAQRVASLRDAALPA